MRSCIAVRKNVVATKYCGSGDALERLLEIDIKIVDRHVDKLISSPNVNVRRTCIKAMIAKSDAERFPLLAKSLDDVNPALRREVAAGLIALAENADHREPVIESTIAVLNENAWRGCEQAVVVLTKLDHKPAGRRMVELLKHERPRSQSCFGVGVVAASDQRAAS